MDIQNIIEYIKPYIKAAKNIKKNDWILIYNDKLICINNESSIMYTMNIISTNVKICNTVENVLEFGNYMNYRMYYFILDKYTYLSNSENILNNKFEMDDLQLDETFSNLLKLKARDPMHHYIIDNVYIPIFYGYLPINKADTLNIKGGLLEDNSVLIKYTVFKKKLKCNIDIYMRLLPVL